MDPVTTSPTAKQVHDDIEQILQAAAAAETRAEKLEGMLKTGGARLWRAMKRHPFLSMAALAVGGIGMAAAVGAAELWFGGALAFAAYKILREGEPPLQALQELEKELTEGGL
jgi:hypothetical protein